MPAPMFGRQQKRGRIATSDVSYTDEEFELLKAITHWRQQNEGRLPDYRDVLRIVKELGWRKTGAVMDFFDWWRDQFVGSPLFHNETVKAVARQAWEAALVVAAQSKPFPDPGEVPKSAGARPHYSPLQ